MAVALPDSNALAIIGAMTAIKNLVLDMDGVLWRGNTPMPGLNELFETLDSLGIGYALATNNAARTAVMYTEKLAGFGVTMPAERIITSAEATADYLAGKYDPGTAVYIIGDQGLHDAFSARGFTSVTTQEVVEGQTAPLVVAGFFRGATYDLMAGGALLITKGAHFVGTNPDVSFPSELGKLPGAGAILAFIAAATGVEPEVIGKPGKIMFEQAMKRLGSSPQTTAMVGDRLNTDIAGARAAGMQTILVLSGISTREDLTTSDYQPDHIFDDIAALTTALQNGHLQ